MSSSRINAQLPNEKQPNFAACIFKRACKCTFIRLIIVRLVRTLVIFTAVALSGCVIAHDRIARGASGTVVDATSGKPLAGVSILRIVGSRENEPTLLATTDSAGQFSVAELDKWYVTVPLGDAAGISQLLFRHTGYGEATIDTSTGIPAPKMPPLKALVVKLRRKA